MPAFRNTVIFALVLALACTCAQAAELGDPVVLSHTGQPLVADIELTALADPAQPVAVKLSSLDVYRGANIAMNPVLASVTMSVMRRDGRQFLHITSVKPVDSEYVHLFLDLVDGGKRNVRAATLWLTPDPNPAPPPVPARPAAPVVEEPARPAKPAIVLRQPPAPAAGTPTFTAEQIKQCAAIDYKNGLLSAQIVELEEKVKALQAAMEGKAEVKAAVKAEVKPAPKKMIPTPPLAPLKAASKPVADESFPWLLVVGGVALLAGLGGGVYFFVRRRKAKSVEGAAADTVAWYAKLASRFKRKPKAILTPEDEAPGAS